MTSFKVCDFISTCTGAPATSDTALSVGEERMLVGGGSIRRLCFMHESVSSSLLQL